MLHLYRRHRTTCPHRAWTYRRCQCPLYVKGTLAGTFIKKSLDLTSWEAATKLIGDWTREGQIGQLTDLVKTVDEAVEAYLTDAHSRGLTPATLGKYRVLLEARLLAWCKRESLQLLPSLDLDALTRFRASWPDAPLAKQKNTERLRAFFSWCVVRGWLRSSPAAGLGAVKAPHNPTLPFNITEQAAILNACDRYPARNSYGHDNRARVKAFVLVLRWSGLRISDVTALQWAQVQDGKIRLYTHKTGTHVSVPVPQEVLSALDAIRTDAPYVFWSGNGLLKSAVADWQRSLRIVFKLAEIEGGHAHRFRDTFAIELLLSGVGIQDVSVLLGHASVKVTERHYSPWVAARQTRLESLVQSSWQTGSAPASIEPPQPSGPVPRPMPESASIAPASEPLARTGSDAEPSPARRSRLRLVSSR